MSRKHGAKRSKSHKCPECEKEFFENSSLHGVEVDGVSKWLVSKVSMSKWLVNKSFVANGHVLKLNVLKLHL
jgi:hypothetical protein